MTGATFSNLWFPTKPKCPMSSKYQVLLEQPKKVISISKSLKKVMSRYEYTLRTIPVLKTLIFCGTTIEIL